MTILSLPISALSARGQSTAWMLIFMISFAIVLLPVFLLILRRRKRKEGAELHKLIEKAKADILEDGIVEGPKGPRARHIPWGRKRGSRNDSGPPKHSAYDGGPWR